MLEQVPFGHCILLNGTPIQNSAEELGSLLYFLLPDEFGDSSDFLEKNGVISHFDTLAGSQQLIEPILLRRRKSDFDSTITRKEERIIEVELT
jgi:SNF2 family DNA or RNA helicase